MSEDCFESGEKLCNPYIEVGRMGPNGNESSPEKRVKVNSSQAKYLGEGYIRNVHSHRQAFQHSTERGEVPLYEVWGVVGQSGFCGDINIREAPKSRTLIGFMETSALHRNLPNTFRELQRL